MCLNTLTSRKGGFFVLNDMKDNGRTFSPFAAPDTVVAGGANSDGIAGEPLSIAVHAEGGVQWAQQLQEAHGFAMQRKNDKALSLWTTAMGNRATLMSGEWKYTDIPVNEKLNKTVYAELFKRVKQEPVDVTPEYRNAILFDVVPVLTAVNGISQSTSELGYNNVGEIVETAYGFLRAEQASKKGGKVVILGQMCAQYDSGSSHDQESFNRGLVQELDREKITRSFAPLKRIIDAVEPHGISVHVVTPQISENPKLMLAMVPATVWSYIDSGQAATMLHTVGQHTRDLPPMIHEALAVDHTTPRSHEAPSYAEVLTNGHNIIERTMEIATLFGQAYSLKDKGVVYEDATVTQDRWMGLSADDLKDFRREINYFEGMYERIIQQGIEVYGWTPEDVEVYKSLLFPLFQENWGALDDTAKFYAREVSRRAEAQSAEWKRNINYEREIPVLLDDEKFYPDYPADYRQAKAEELLEWVEKIANLEIGGRAIFNVALYAALGEALAKYEEGEDVALMWPMEEDRDRWGVEAMTRAYQRKIPSAKALPCVYQAKNLRQPFGV